MKFESLKRESPAVRLSEAVMKGIAPDGSLYMPETIPQMPPEFFERAKSMPFRDIAFEASKVFFTPDIPEAELRKMTDEAFNFEVPLKKIDTGVYTLELFHGPTAAFKDFGARFMARVLGYFAKESGNEVTILVATSGDTGSAVAHGFLNVPGIKVVILYPSGKVSPLQEKQLTSMGGNITALEVDGVFDDCQRMVKEAFADDELQHALTLSSANSINLGRMLPQLFYYIYAACRLQAEGKRVVVSVPSGNYGNLTAGIIAKKMGAPIDRFIASTNGNDVVPEYLETGIYTPRPSVPTISNAMDVGAPSNFARMLELYGHDVEKMKQDIYGVSFTDDETRTAILDVFKTYGYIMDPHGAVAYLGLRKFQSENPGFTGAFLETADPAKFAEVVEPVIGHKVPMPERLGSYLTREKQVVSVKNEFSALKQFLLNA